MSIHIPARVLGHDLKQYFLDHAVEDQDLGHGFYKITKPLHVFKKASSREVLGDSKANRIVNLVIPVGASVYIGAQAFDAGGDADDRKMRASVAEVFSIAQYASRGYRFHHHNWMDDDLSTNFDPKMVKPAAVAHSSHDPQFQYRPGKTVTPINPFDTYQDQCAAGIHFFLNLRDALRYY